MVEEDKTVRLGPFPRGMNNKTSDHDLPEGTVRNAVNVDFTNSGKARRRKGSATKVYSGFPKGGYSCAEGVFFVENGSLKQFNSDNTATTLCSGILGTTYAWDCFNGAVYFSDGIVCKKIVSGVANNWGMARPSPPVLSTTSGSYGAGVYLAACSFVDANGVESGASQIVSVSAGANCGIIFSNIPPVTDPQAVYVRLYLSMPDGEVLYHVADVLPNTQSYQVIAGRYDDSSILDLAFVSPAPAGRIIRFANGRAIVADADRVWYSDPYQYDHFRLGDNFIQFTDTVDLMEPVTGGCFFAYGNKTEFWAGDIFDAPQAVQSVNYGAVYGTGKKIPNSQNVCWQSQRGMVVGTPDGQMKNVVEDNVAVDTAVYGASLIREQDGLRQFIATLKTPTISTMAATSWITAEQIRRS